MAFQISNLMSYVTMTSGELEHKLYLLLYSECFPASLLSCAVPGPFLP